MAASQGQERAERHRRHPFSYLRQKLANLKHSGEATDGSVLAIKPRSGRVRKAYVSSTSSTGGDGRVPHSPYLAQPHFHDAVHPYTHHLHHRSDTILSRSSRPRRNLSDPSLGGDSSTSRSHDHHERPLSKAPTVSTSGGTVQSDTGVISSNATSTAVTHSSNGISTSFGGGEGSTFSSPAPSIHSLTTTLTTVHSGAPSTALGHGPGNGTITNHQQHHQNHNHQQHQHQQHHHHHHHNHNHQAQHNGTPQSSYQTTYFSHQYPVTPASAVPAHLAPHSGTTTYNNAMASNVLTDDASTRTLASSTRHKRRTSADTNASVKALAPNSVFNASRESLPLSQFSPPLDHVTTTSASTMPPSTSLNHAILTSGSIPSSTSIYNTSGRHLGGGQLPNSHAPDKSSLYADKASLYSSRGDRVERETGLPSSTAHSERNSVQFGNDAASLMSTKSGNVIRAKNDGQARKQST